MTVVPTTTGVPVLRLVVFLGIAVSLTPVAGFLGVIRCLVVELTVSDLFELRSSETAADPVFAIDRRGSPIDDDVVDNGDSNDVPIPRATVRCVRRQTAD